MSILIRAHYDGKTIVPEADVDLPVDQPLEVQVSLVSPTDTGSEASSPAVCDKPDFTALPSFGMWADREDMADSVAWVNKERDKWGSRLSDTE